MRFFRRASKPARLYTRHPCPLCDRLVSDLERARLRPRLELERIDVDLDPELSRRFGASVPVLEVDGTILVRGVWSLPELERRYAALCQEAPSC